MEDKATVKALRTVNRQTRANQFTFPFRATVMMSFLVLNWSLMRWAESLLVGRREESPSFCTDITNS